MAAINSKWQWWSKAMTSKEILATLALRTVGKGKLISQARRARPHFCCRCLPISHDSINHENAWCSSPCQIMAILSWLAWGLGKPNETNILDHGFLNLFFWHPSVHLWLDGLLWPGSGEPGLSKPFLPWVWRDLCCNGLKKNQNEKKIMETSNAN